jgi:hypothetical protein
MSNIGNHKLEEEESAQKREVFLGGIPIDCTTGINLILTFSRDGKLFENIRASRIMQNHP